MNPACILDLAWFVQIERNARSEDVGALLADDYRSPRRDARRLKPALRPGGVWREE